MRQTRLNRTTGALVITVLAVVLVLSVFRSVRPRSAEADADTPEARGQAVFAENCSACHHHDSRETKIGPGLVNLFNRKTLPASGRPATEANVRRQLIDPYKAMPKVGEDLTKAQTDDLIAFLKTT